SFEDCLCTHAQQFCTRLQRRGRLPLHKILGGRQLDSLPSSLHQPSLTGAAGHSAQSMAAPVTVPIRLFPACRHPLPHLPPYRFYPCPRSRRPSPGQRVSPQPHLDNRLAFVWGTALASSDLPDFSRCQAVARPDPSTSEAEPEPPDWDPYPHRPSSPCAFAAMRPPPPVFH